MPAVKQINTSTYQVLVWKIEEDMDFFAQNIQLSYQESQDFASITNENRRLEWLASRFVQRQVVNDSLIKDEHGKPYLKNQAGFISIAHCKNYATAIYGQDRPVGIDIEPIDDKVLRISRKFLNPNELKFIDADNNPQHIISAWCVKEAVFKWYGRKELSFKNNIKTQTFTMRDHTVLVHFEKNDFIKSLSVSIQKIDNCMLAFTC